MVEAPTSSARSVPKPPARTPAPSRVCPPSALLAQHRETLFPDELFADLFPSGRGRPSVPAAVAATAMVLQSLEGLSDREARERLRCDIRWKVATGLPLDHEGFHCDHV
jgi:hypothetical protein